MTALPSQRKCWLTNQDGLDKLQRSESPLQQPGDKEVLVKINTVSLNYRDTEVCMGLYGHHKSVSQAASLIPCSDMCGTIVATGKDSSFSKGSRVVSIFNQTHQTGQVQEKDMASGLGLPLPGVLTEYRVFPDCGLVPVPEYLSDEEACTLPIAALTAWISIQGFQPISQPLRNQDITVLVQGTGGVSICGLQIAKACGLKAIVTSSSDEKLEKASKLGADHTINYKKNPDWHEEVLRLTGGKGADIIFECGGAQTLEKSFDCVAFGGLISCIGYLSGKEDAAGSRMNTNVLALKRNVTLKGILNGPKDRFEEMLRLYEELEIHPAVDKVFPFDEAKEALQYLFSGGHFGKVVVKIA
ncbi:hypothetical protein AAFC00_004694 [Neodothiora populina]|uniref:Enoyl reductase (ER) domain-containing protein n=1 Tax=Neodothiora populina TaxID=2781224 RepID=A0ABR3P312_9PEZI